MSDLANHLESLLRNFAAECDQDKDDQPWNRFRDELRWLIAEHGANAIDAALDEIPDFARNPACLH